MKPSRRNQFVFIGALMIVAILISSCQMFPVPATSPPQQPAAGGGKIGDYGDAPDGDRNMDTGYYAPTGGPFIFSYSSAGVAGNFPTMGDDPIPGPYMIDVSQFWIGPLFGVPNPVDEPSREDDADDPQDPDTVANLLIQGGGADCDRENGSHSPASTGCSPVSAYSIPMNARLLIMFGYPPLGVWITAVNAPETMTYDGPVYWNLLVDLNQDGKWNGEGEWIAQDVKFDLVPGEHKTLISPPFKLATSGTPWGRLNFPFWVRSMVSSESIQDKLGPEPWDGRGTEDGFAIGEVEDYFVEWQPIGQKFPGKEPRKTTACAVVSAEEIVKAPVLSIEEVLRTAPGASVNQVRVIAGENLMNGGVVVYSAPVDLSSDSETTFTAGEDDLTLRVENRMFSVLLKDMFRSPQRATFTLGIMSLYESPSCTGSAPVAVTPGIFQVFSRPTTVSVAGVYSVNSVFDSGFIDHDPFAEGSLINSITVTENSITFSGNPPFVTVTGERNEADGSFFADGRGVVAGFPDIAVTFDGTIGDGQLSGLYTMGAEGGLPTGQSITYKITGSITDKPVEAPDDGPIPLPEGVVDAIESFIEVFNTAFEGGDTGSLYQLLHPSVIELYGEEACLAYMDTIVETPTSIEYLDATKVGAWDWERDGATLSVEYAYSVLVNFTAQDQTVQQEIHLTLPGDNSVRWFTDCGDPLSE